MSGNRLVEAASADGTLPLYAAAVGGHAEAVALLLGAGADPNAESAGESDGTPLCAAACWGFEPVVSLLLEAGADAGRAEGGALSMAPLDWAAAGMHAGVARQLLDAGADPSGSRPDMTPLQEASDRGSIALVSLLLERGADPTVALEIAESWLGVDVEASLRDELSTDDVEFVVRREPRAEGSELIEVTARPTRWRWADRGARDRSRAHRRVAHGGDVRMTRVRIGDVAAISLDDDKVAYVHVLARHEALDFYFGVCNGAHARSKEMPVERIVEAGYALLGHADGYLIACGDWPVVGRVKPDPSRFPFPRFKIWQGGPDSPTLAVEWDGQGQRVAEPDELPVLLGMTTSSAEADRERGARAPRPCAVAPSLRRSQDRTRRPLPRPGRARRQGSATDHAA